MEELVDEFFGHLKNLPQNSFPDTIFLESLGITVVVFLSLAGLLAAIVFGVPPALVNIGIGGGIAVIIILGVYFTYHLRKWMFETRQHKKGLVKFVDRRGDEKWGKPEEVKKWEQKDFKQAQIEKGLVKYKRDWVTPQEREYLKKGYVKYVDRYGIEIWNTPAKINKIKKIDEEERIKESLEYRVVQAIKEFEPARKLRDEYVYENSLYSWLKSQFPKIKVQTQKGSSRPDIVIENIAIEIKGPTRRTDQLDSVSGKLLRYPQHFEKIIVVIFDVTVSESYFNEWLRGLREKFPEVEVIRKD